MIGWWLSPLGVEPLDREAGAACLSIYFLKGLELMRDSLDLRDAVKTPPPIPSKTDVIPIHTSDRGSFKRCRRYWQWASPMRDNLRPKVTLSGVNLPLWFGTGIHYALEQYYDPLLRRDPLETFKTWYELQMHGGHIHENDLRLTYDPQPVQFDTSADGRWDFYSVRGLEELHPDPDLEEFNAHLELGIGMLTFYTEWASANDNFAVIATEHDFSVPLGFDAVDPRDGITKPVHYRGREDCIVQSLDSGRFGIIDHKTAARIDEDYFRKLEKDEQCTSYLWAAEQEAKIYDLPYKEVDFVIYNVLRKNFPKPPTITSRGLPSLDRQKESTTAEMFRQCIEENNLQLWFDNDEKAQGYLAWLDDLGDENFIIRKPVRRNRAEIESAGWRIEAEARDMLSIGPGIRDPDGSPNKKIYPSPNGEWLCLNCAFRAPCIAFDDGSDWDLMIKDGYESNVGR
jgi:hypothetical protein